MKSKVNILLLLKIPPPVHGSSLINEQIFNSSLVCEDLDCHKITQSISTSIEDVGSFSFRKLKKIVFNYSLLIKELIKQKPSFVYYPVSPFGFALIKDLLSIIIIRLFRCKPVYHFHTKGLKEISENNTLYKFAYLFMFSGAIAITLSEELVSDIEPFNFEKIFIIPNGIEKVSVVPDKKEGSFVVTFIGNYFKSKGILDFLEYAESILKVDQSVGFNIIGQDKDLTANEIKNKFHEIGHEQNLLYVGPIYGDEKFKKLNNSDLFVYPTHNDCYPLVLLEAMQSGLPIISTRIGSIPSIVIEGENGYLTEIGDVQTMVNKTIEIKENSQLYNSMKEKSIELFNKNNTLRAFEYKMNEVFKKIISE